jgi:enoyl-[acyl-carrier-protein] reductase (NADH)
MKRRQNPRATSLGYVIFVFVFIISPSTQRLQFVQNRPLKQDGQAEDIASVVSYLASKEAHFITGEFNFVSADRM